MTRPGPTLTGLTLIGVGKRYGRHIVLRDVGLVVRPGQVVVVSGPNGCGKSTLVSVAAGLTAPSYGEVRRPRRTALVPDRFTPPERMTGREYLRHHARMRRLGPAAGARRVGELAERLEVRPGLDVELRRLSQGNARKVQLAQAFLAPVDLLFLDEPTGVLDAPAACAVDHLLEEAAAQGTAVLRVDPAGTPGRGHRRLRLADGVVREP